jgi:phenylacetate-coenzyme A ligase PaaK-like adenylate-forming protein
MIKPGTIYNTRIENGTSTLEQALASIPFYQQWREYDPGPSVTLSKRMAALPILTKKALRANMPYGFVSSSYKIQDGFNSSEIEMVSTSGTVEERVSIVWNQSWWDNSEREAAKINPVLDTVYNKDHREAILTTPVCAGNLCHVGEVPMLERIVGNLLFLNQSLDPTSWDQQNIQRMAEEMILFQPEVIEADSAYLAILSKACLDHGYQLFQPECIVLTYEFPSQIHYRWIHQAFPGIPVISSYGSTETGHVFTQCENGLFHQNSATCYVDIQPFKQEYCDHRIGRILVTTLDNPWCTLLRFDVGDLARIHDSMYCQCGRSNGLILDSIEGRYRDVTFDSEDRIVTLKKLDDALIIADRLIGYHLEQTEPRRYSMRYAAEPGKESQTEGIIEEVLRSVYGKDVQLEINHDSALPPEQSGKFRLTKTEFNYVPEKLFQ